MSGVILKDGLTKLLREHASARFKPLHAGDAVTSDQGAVLAATYSFLNETINAAFDVVCTE